MFSHCGRDSMVEFQLPKLTTRVRFPSPAPANPPAPSLDGAVLHFGPGWRHPSDSSQKGCP